MSLKSAVPDEKRTLMVNLRLVARLRLTVKSIVSSTPSVAVASLIETVRGAALTMVPVPPLLPKVAPWRLVSTSQNVSLPSLRASSRIGTETVLRVSPGRKVKVPFVPS